MKIKLFTHNDLDGIGCAVLGKLAYPDRLDYTLCTYSNINDQVCAFMKHKDSKKYTHIFITDIIVTPEVATKLNGFGPKVVLVDHHAMNVEMANQLGYPWLQISDDPSESGTSLFYRMVKDLIPVNDSLTKFVNLVRLYDTWLWAKDWTTQAVALSKFCYGDLNGRIDELVNLIRADSIDEIMRRFNPDDLFKRLEESIKNSCYIVGDYMVGINMDDISLMGELVRRQDIKVKALIDIRPSALRGSVRSIADDFDSAAFAQTLGGGGHVKAAGFQLSKEYAQQMADFAMKILLPKKKKETKEETTTE